MLVDFPQNLLSSITKTCGSDIELPIPRTEKLQASASRRHGFGRRRSCMFLQPESFPEEASNYVENLDSRSSEILTPHFQCSLLRESTKPTSTFVRIPSCESGPPSKCLAPESNLSRAYLTPRTYVTASTHMAIFRQRRTLRAVFADSEFRSANETIKEQSDRFSSPTSFGISMPLKCLV